MTDIQTIITAAGDSRPLFLTSGFASPKSLVMRDGATVIQRAIASYVTDLQRSILALNADEQRDWPIRENVGDLYPDVAIVEVSSSVKGALASALIAMEDLLPDLPLVIAAGDSEIRGGIAPMLHQLRTQDAAAGTIVFPSTDPRWSYIAVDSQDRVVQIAEKRVVGPLATTGVFYFSRASLFLEAAEWCLVNSASHQGTYFVSTALNYIVNQGMSVGYAAIERAAYVPSALPVDFVAEGR